MGKTNQSGSNSVREVGADTRTPPLHYATLGGIRTFRNKIVKFSGGGVGYHHQRAPVRYRGSKGGLRDKNAPKQSVASRI
jgi:hypothetical protein